MLRQMWRHRSWDVPQSPVGTAVVRYRWDGCCAALGLSAGGPRCTAGWGEGSSKVSCAFLAPHPQLPHLSRCPWVCMASPFGMLEGRTAEGHIRFPLGRQLEAPICTHQGTDFRGTRAPCVWLPPGPGAGVDLHPLQGDARAWLICHAKKAATFPPL